ncbi:hypothetical protein AB0F52_41390 [Amycolatopsis sp. NPDC024027]|uniref:hypothetical protein n=1 Tax=Amycolatopsis sp. NPDC024027 TaxID=3154327 RepID=UPI0033DF2679
MMLVHQYPGATGDDGAGSVPMLIGTAVVVLLVLAGIRGRELRPRKLFLLPGIVVLIGLAAVLPPLAGGRPLHGIDAVLASADLALSIGLGAVRGRTVRIDLVAGVSRYRYGPATVLLWGLSIALRFALGAYGARHGASPLVTEAAVLLMLGLTLLTQNIIVFARAAARARRGLPGDPVAISGAIPGPSHP